MPFGEANVVREGGDVTIVTLGRMVHTSLEAAEQLAADGVRVRGRRPAHHQPARRGHDAGERRGHRPARRGRRGATRGARSPPTSRRWSPRKAFGSLRAPIEMVTGAAHAGAVLQRARGHLHPGRAARRERRQDGDRSGPDDRRPDRRRDDAEVGPVDAARQDHRAGSSRRATTVQVGDDLADIETEKIAGTLEAADAGTVRRIVARVGRGRAGQRHDRADRPGRRQRRRPRRRRARRRAR